jgi:hypothetical protein
MLDADGGVARRRLPRQHAVADVRAGQRGHAQPGRDGPRAGPAAALGLGRDERRALMGGIGGLADRHAVAGRRARDQIDLGVAARVEPTGGGDLRGRVPGPPLLGRDPGLAVARPVGVAAAGRAVAADRAGDVVERRVLPDVELGQTRNRRGGGPPAGRRRSRRRHRRRHRSCPAEHQAACGGRSEQGRAYTLHMSPTTVEERRANGSHARPPERYRQRPGEGFENAIRAEESGFASYRPGAAKLVPRSESGGAGRGSARSGRPADPAVQEQGRDRRRVGRLRRGQR